MLIKTEAESRETAKEIVNSIERFISEFGLIKVDFIGYYKRVFLYRSENWEIKFILRKDRFPIKSTMMIKDLISLHEGISIYHNEDCVFGIPTSSFDNMASCQGILELLD